MIQYSDYVYFSGTNNPVNLAEVSVYIADTTTLATLYADAIGTIPKTNPVTTDQNGFFSFYAAQGRYDLYYLGVKQYQISINETTGIPDPLSVQVINCSTLNVTGTGAFTASNALDILFNTVTSTLNESGSGATTANIQSALRGVLNLSGSRSGSANASGIRSEVDLVNGFTSSAGQAHLFRGVATINTTSPVASVHGMNCTITQNVAGTIQTLIGSLVNIITAAGGNITNNIQAISGSITLNGDAQDIYLRTGTLTSTNAALSVNGTVSGTGSNFNIAGNVVGQILGIFTGLNPNATAALTTPNFGGHNIQINNNNAASDIGTMTGQHMFSIGTQPLVSNYIAGTFFDSSMVALAKTGASVYAHYTDINKVAGKNVYAYYSAGDATSVHNGKVLIGTNAETFGQVEVVSNPTGDAQSAGIHIVTVDATDGTTNANTTYGLVSEVSSAVVKAGTAAVGAIRGALTLDASFSRSSGSVFGGAFAITNNATGTVSQAIGLSSNITTGTGTVTTVIGTNTTITCQGTITTARGVTSNSSVSITGNVTTMWGFFNQGNINGTCGTYYGFHSSISMQATGIATTVYGGLFTLNPPAGARVNGGFVGVSVAQGLNNPCSPSIRGIEISGTLHELCDAGGTTVAFYTGMSKAAGKNVYSIYSFGDAPSYFGGALITLNVPVYANNAAAIAGGLVVGMHYRTGGDPDHLCIVH